MKIMIHQQIHYCDKLNVTNNQILDKCPKYCNKKYSRNQKVWLPKDKTPNLQQLLLHIYHIQLNLCIIVKKIT